MRWRNVGVLALVALAGCSAHAPDPEGAGMAEDGSRAEWTGCDGLMVALDGPSAVYAGSVPPGWEAGHPINTVQVEAYRCDRLAWGPFERGPVLVVQEWHGDFAAPASCRTAGVYDLRTVLQSIWFDDEEIAAYAREVHGMPAFAASFVEGGLPDVTGSLRLAWRIPGEAESTVTLHDLPGQADHASIVVHRVYWDNGDGVSLMDFREEFASDDLDSNSATGALQPPFLHGRSMPSPQFATPLANRQSEASASSSIAHYEDYACNAPA